MKTPEKVQEVNYFDKVYKEIQHLKSEFRNTTSNNVEVWGEVTVQVFENAFVMGAISVRYAMALKTIEQLKQIK